MSYRKMTRKCRAKHVDMRDVRNMLLCQRADGHKGHHRCGGFTWTDASSRAIPVSNTGKSQDEA